MLAERTAQYRGEIQRARRLTSADDRYIDYGILIRPAKQDLKNGVEAIAGKPPLVPDGEPIRLGGMLDTLTREFGPSRNPVVWYVSRRQLRLILHQVKESRILIHAAEGAGKSRTLVMHSVVQVIANLGYTGFAGLVAPTGERLRTMVTEMGNVIPIDTPHERKKGSWATYYNLTGNTGELRFRSGITVQFRSSHQASVALGSPLQGANWLWCDADEHQDIIEEGNRDADIEARLRVAPHGKSKRLCTATAKDAVRWRDFVDEKKKSKFWSVEPMPYDTNIAVWPSHWVTMRGNMSKREWMRRGLALNVKPERATYPEFQRSVHLKPLPDATALDCTEQTLRSFRRRGGYRYDILLGHDPGSICNYSVFFKCFRVRGIADPVWFAVDELKTDATSSEQHAAALLKVLREKHHTNYKSAESNKALVICDPANEFESQDRPHLSTYKIFVRLGIDIKSAAPKTHKVPKLAGVEMINGLFMSTLKQTRLYLGVGEDGKPLTPWLLKAIETQERGLDGKIEWERKSKYDTSHYTAAARYALWPIERVRLSKG